MHKTSYENMRQFVEKYLSSRVGEKLTIVDLGSQDVNGMYTYRDFFQKDNWKYVGVDMEEGKNVDVVIKNVYKWEEFADVSVDVVISGQTFEHIEYIWLTMQEISRILKPGGWGCIIAPSSGYEHKYPLDCWRILPDGFKALARYANLEVVEVYVSSDEFAQSLGEENTWRDCVLVFKK